MNLKLTIRYKISDLYWGTNDFKNCYEPRTNVVQGKKGDQITDSHSFFARWKKHFSQPFNVHGVSEVKQREIQTAEPLVPDPSAFDVGMAIEELKRHKSGTDHFPADLIKAGDRNLRSEISKLINSIWNKEDLPDEKKDSIVVPIYKKGDKTDCSNYRGVSLSAAHKILHNILPSRLTPYAVEISWDILCGF